MEPGGRFERPPQPERQFPADTDPAGVDLVYERPDWHSGGQLSGSALGQPAQVSFAVPAHDGSASGTFAGQPLSAAWDIGSNYDSYPDVPAELTGTFAGDPVELRATFHLAPGYFLNRGTIDGHIGPQAVAATVERAAGGLGSTSTVAIDGRLETTWYTIYAAISPGHDAAKIRGSVAGQPIRIDAARTGQPGYQPDGKRIRVTGIFAGPAALLALVVGTVLYFL